MEVKIVAIVDIPNSSDVEVGIEVLNPGGQVIHREKIRYHEEYFNQPDEVDEFGTVIRTGAQVAEDLIVQSLTATFARFKAGPPRDRVPEAVRTRLQDKKVPF